MRVLSLIAYLLIAGFLTFLGAMWLHNQAHAHLADRPDLNAWAMSLKSKGGMPCCDGSDAEPIKDADWDQVDGHYRVHVNGEWWDVADSSVVPSSNRYGGALVWGYWSGTNDKRIFIVRCFLPGAGI
jgi:hypothetical protein